MPPQLHRPARDPLPPPGPFHSSGRRTWMAESFASWWASPLCPTNAWGASPSFGGPLLTSGGERCAWQARDVLDVARPFGVPVLINDRLDVALAAGWSPPPTTSPRFSHRPSRRSRSLPLPTPWLPTLCLPSPVSASPVHSCCRCRRGACRAERHLHAKRPCNPGAVCHHRGIRRERGGGLSSPHSASADSCSPPVHLRLDLLTWRSPRTARAQQAATNTGNSLTGTLPLHLPLLFLSRSAEPQVIRWSSWQSLGLVPTYLPTRCHWCSKVDSKLLGLLLLLLGPQGPGGWGGLHWRWCCVPDINQGRCQRPWGRAEDPRVNLLCRQHPCCCDWRSRCLQHRACHQSRSFRGGGSVSRFRGPGCQASHR